MREGSEKGRARKRRWNAAARGGRRGAEGERERDGRGFDEAQELEDDGKKAGQKGTFRTFFVC